MKPALKIPPPLPISEPLAGSTAGDDWPQPGVPAQPPLGPGGHSGKGDNHRRRFIILLLLLGGTNLFKSLPR